MEILKRVIAPMLCAAALLFGGALGATERALTLLLVPAIGGEGSPQLAISWKGTQAGQLELSAVAADGQRRVLQTRALTPGMVLEPVALAASDQTLLAVLRDAQGRELARAESAAQLTAPRLGADAPVDVGQANVTPTAPRAKGITQDWKLTFSGNEAPNGTVLATTIYDDGTGPALVIGGDFTTAGGVLVNRIARWNGSAWTALGSGAGSGVGGAYAGDFKVSALAASGRDLYVGGDFTRANLGSTAVVASRIARWNGGAWSALGSGGGNGVGGPVNALAVSGSDLYVGGEFHFATAGDTVVATSRVARWNGSAWSALGSGGGNGVDSAVFALATSGSDIYVGGSFSQVNIGGRVVAANAIARWNGSAWSAVGSGGGNGVDSIVFALASSGSDLYVGGSFSQVNVGGTVVAANWIARWNGSAWSALGSDGGNGVNSAVNALAVSGSDLYVGGRFTQANVGGTVVAANRIARWNGIAWSARGSSGGNGVNNVVNALAVSDSDLYVGGNFIQANVGGTVVAASNIAHWNASTWSALGSSGLNGGPNGSVFAMTIYDDGTGPGLVIGGAFTTVGGVLATRIARWNGSAWSPFGSGGGNGLDSNVHALSAIGSDLYVGGFFGQANVGGTVVAANRIARWNGSTWSALGSGSGNGVNSAVVALASSGSDLYVGGSFSQANVGGTIVAANRIARWNGSAWLVLGSDGGNGVDANVLAIAFSGGELYVGGAFTQAAVGGTGVAANRIARWNGSAWSALGSGGGNGVDSIVRTLAFSGSDLFVGGDFTGANMGGTMVAASSIARWNGSTWSALGSSGGNGVANSVVALAVSGRDLYAGGTFTQADVGGTAVTASYIASWNGRVWTALGSGGINGVNQPVDVLLVSGSDLFVGGRFTQLTGGGTTLAANRLVAYGLTDSSLTEISSTHPASSRAGEPVQIRARVVASTAPTAGQVNIAGAPGGSCSDLTLTPINATTSEAECTIRWNTAGPRTLTATYLGGVNAAGSWQTSASAPFAHMVVLATDLLFANGFETPSQAY